MGVVAELMVKIGADTKGLQTGLGAISKASGKVVTGLGTISKTAGSVVTGLAKVGAAGTLALGALIVKATYDGIQGIMAMDDATAQLNAVLKSTNGAVGLSANAISGMATALQKTTKFAEEDTLAGENMLLTFTNIGKDVFPQATKTLLDLSTAMGTDAKSGAIQLGKALNDPTQGISALTRVGVTFTDEQKKVIKKLQETGDMAGAQKVILAELNKEFGGSAEAAGQTFSGQLVILKNTLGEVEESLAAKLMPYLQTFMSWVSDHMPDIESIAGKAFKLVGSALVTVGNYIKDNVIPTFQKLYGWIEPNIPAIKDFIKNAFDTIRGVLKAAGDFVINTLLPAFVSFWNWIKPYMPQIKDAVNITFDIIKGAFKLVGGIITNVVIPVFKTMAEWFFANFPRIKDAVMQAYNYIKPSFDKLVAVVKSDLMPIITGLWDTIKLAMPGIKAVFAIAFPIIVAVVKTVIDIIVKVIQTIKGIYDFIKPGLDLVAKIFSTVFGGIKKLIDGVQTALTFKWPTLPAFHWPTLPSITLPKISWPTLPTFRWPTLPNIKLPTITWPTLPAFHWPTLPKITLPTIKWPTLPAFHWPTLPKISLPSIHWPTLPAFHWPTIPKITLPSITWPYIKMPHFTLTGSFSLIPPRIPTLGVKWYAKGVENFGGGLAGINERGGEIVNLPQGTNVIPHDVSMQIAKSIGSSRSSGGDTYNLTITGNKISNDYDVNRMMDQVVKRLKLAGV